MSQRRPALGKGLSALIPDAPVTPRQGTMEVDIDHLAPSDQQPRLQIDDERLAEFKASGRLDKDVDFSADDAVIASAK